MNMDNIVFLANRDLLVIAVETKVCGELLIQGIIVVKQDVFSISEKYNGASKDFWNNKHKYQNPYYNFSFPNMIYNNV